jgi:hypothetical protein
MLEDQAAFGVVGLIMIAVTVVFVFMRFNSIFVALWVAFMRIMKTRVALVSLLFLALSLLIYGVASFGLVNSLPKEEERHVERNRENNRMIIGEDKDGCIDMRTLGRSNGVYLSLKKCDTTGKKDQAENK